MSSSGISRRLPTRPARINPKGVASPTRTCAGTSEGAPGARRCHRLRDPAPALACRARAPGPVGARVILPVKRARFLPQHQEPAARYQGFFFCPPCSSSCKASWCAYNATSCRGGIMTYVARDAAAPAPVLCWRRRLGPGPFKNPPRHRRRKPVLKKIRSILAQLALHRSGGALLATDLCPLRGRASLIQGYGLSETTGLIAVQHGRNPVGGVGSLAPVTSSRRLANGEILCVAIRHAWLLRHRSGRSLRGCSDGKVVPHFT